LVDRPDQRHPEDQATKLICEVASTTLGSVGSQPDFEAMVDRIGQAMGLLSQLAYGMLDLQNPDHNNVFRAAFHRAFSTGRTTARGIVEMVKDPAVT
jgi:hypothetical protein